MAKRSDIERQIAQLQAELESADTDDEVWVKDHSGHEVKVTGRRATTVLDRFRELWATEEAGEDAGEDAGEGDGPDAGDDPPGGSAGAQGGTSYFSRRKK